MLFFRAFRKSATKMKSYAVYSLTLLAAGSLVFFSIFFSGCEQKEENKKVSEKNEEPVLSDLNAVDFADFNIGFAVGKSGVILRTEDSGKTFNLVKSPTEKDLTDVYFYDTDHGIIACSDSTYFVTEDGGKTWQEGKTEAPGNVCVYSLGDGIYFIAGEDGSIYRSEDGGKTFKKIKEAHGAAIKRIYFADNTVGYAVGDYQNLFKTEDGGKTWKLVGFPEEFKVVEEVGGGKPDETFRKSAYSLTLLFMDEKFGFAAGFDSLIATEDGGASWKKVELPVVMIIYAMDAFDASNIVAVGNLGFAVVSENGGKTWKKAETGTTKHLYDVCVASEKVAVAAGEDGALLFTEDAGKTWQKSTIELE